MIALSLGSQLTPSSNVITPTHDIHHVAAGNIDTITAPSPAFSGLLILIADGSCPYTTNDNIVNSGSLSSTLNICIYDTSVSKWRIIGG